MKTLILFLAATLSVPAMAQTTYNSFDNTTSPSTVTTPGPQAPTTNASPTLDESNDGAILHRSGSGSDASAPDMAAPATLTPAPMTETSETTTSRTYREDTGAKDRVFGGFYIEPGIVGTREDADVKSSAIGGDTAGTSNSVDFDLKLGGHINDVFFLGADGRYGRSRFEGTSYQDTDATSWNWGPTLGVNAPYFGARAWATYIVDGNYNPDQGINNVDLNFKDPYGWRGGVGIRLSAVSLNLEYQDLTYRTTDVESAGTLAAATTAGTDFAQRGYALSLSFPIDL